MPFNVDDYMSDPFESSKSRRSRRKEAKVEYTSKRAIIVKTKTLAKKTVQLTEDPSTSFAL